MDYIVLHATKDNLRYVLRENARRIEMALKSKVNICGGLPLLAINANGHSVQDVISVEDTDACTVAKFKELRGDYDCNND